MKHRSMILGSVVYLLPACLLLAAGLATYRLFSSGLERRDFAAELGVTATPKLSRPDHVVIVIEENKSFDDIIKSVNAPYLKSLTQRGALLTDFYALHHPSQPNYLEFFAGGDQKVFNDDCLTTRCGLEPRGQSHQQGSILCRLRGRPSSRPECVREGPLCHKTLPLAQLH